MLTVITFENVGGDSTHMSVELAAPGIPLAPALLAWPWQSFAFAAS